MKKIISATALLFLAFSSALHAEIPQGWSVNYSNSLSVAAAARKPALVFFTASWCGPCKMMVRGTLSEAAVQQVLSNVAPVALDIDENHDLASRYGIDAVPTFVILSASGSEVGRVTGYQAPADFLRWLTNGISAAAEAAIRQSVIQKQLDGIDQVLASTDSNGPKRAAADLFELCAERDEHVVSMATERLKAIAVKQPALLLDGLNNPHLAARIQVANILRSRVGEGFDIDPWGEAGDRAKGIQKWRARFASGF
jgi:thioredoxin 1